MSWIAPAMLWFLLLVPAVLLLWFLKIRRTETIVPSTVLWSRALQDERVRSPFQRLIRNLVLLLQLLAVILAVLALARPEFGSTRYSSRLNLILLDASASMNSIERDGKKRFEEARARALKIIDDISGERAVLIRFATRAETLTPVTSDLNLLSDAVRQQQPSSGLTAFPQALELALSIARQDSIVPAQVEEEDTTGEEALAPQIDARIFIVTDGVLPRWDGDPIPVPVIVEPVGEESSNSGIVTLAARREFSDEGDLRVVVEVRNSGDDPIAGELELLLDGQAAQSTERRTLEGGERWTRSFALKGSGSHQLEARWKPEGGDALSLDDRAWLVAAAPRPIRIARVGAPNVLLDDALAVIPSVEVEFIEDPAELDPETAADEFDVVVWDRVVPDALPLGTGHLVFGARPIQFWPDEVPLVEQPRLVSWRRDDPALRYCELGPIDGTVIATRPLPPMPGTTMLAECREGALIARFVADDLRGIVVAFDVLDSPWPLSPSFPFFIDAALRDLARIGGGIESGLHSGELIEVVAGPGVTEARLVNPTLEKETEVPVLPGGVLRIPADDELGIHRMQWRRADQDQGVWLDRWIPVNLLSPLESSIEPRPSIGLAGAEAVSGSQNWSQGRRHLWIWFLATALLVMLVEWIVFHRR
ncbi:MAG: VWA domain-containing protein [Planctomycetota bacterium]|nr:VWA domain-containing protein [Planctomycetota bacterium]